MNQPHLRLEILEAGAPTSLVDLGTRGHYVLGRSAQCDLPLRGTGVSRRHALVVVNGDERAIHDLGSRNGTYVNGKEAGEEGAPLADGDTLRLGPSLLIRVALTSEPVREAVERLESSLRRYELSRPKGEKAAAPSGEPPRFCEGCDGTVTPANGAPRTGALWLDDGAIVCAACAPAVPRREQIGKRYRVLAKLGEGGVATVFKAIDEEVRRVVAVKLMKGQAGEMAVAYLEREVEILRELEHPAIVRLLDSGEHAGARFLVMDLVRGADLESLVHERGKLAPAAALLVGFSVAGGLALAHKRGVVHRDVKPSNVLVERSGVVKLADFGVARWARPVKKRGPSERLTVRGSRRGTPAYMAPEQALDPASAGPPADVYGLGATLYHALAGVPPYGEGTSPVAVLDKLERGEPPADLPAAVVAAHPALAAVVQKALARDPAARHADGEALRAALLGLVEGSAGLHEPFAGV